MITTIFNTQPSILNRFIAELRDINIQNDAMRFRRNLERIGEILAYEISTTLQYEAKTIQTPLGFATEQVPTDQVVLATILRAGLPMHQGMLNYFDDASNAFVSAYRKYTADGEFDIHVEYISSPSLHNKVVILSDPMLATGSSLELVYKALLKKGKPKHVHIAAAIASESGIEYIKQVLKNEPITLWIGAVDEELNAKSFIVPGLGDAGDLAYGEKL